MPGPCTPITLSGLLFTWAWAVAAVGRLALGPGHRLLVVSLPSLVLTTRPPKAPRRAVPQTEAVQVQVSRQLRQLRPLLLLLLCRPSRRRETQALYFDKNCGLFGCSWLFLVDELVVLVVRRDLCGRERAATSGRLATSLPTQVCCCEPAKLQRTQIKALKQPASKLKPENTHHSRTTLKATQTQIVSGKMLPTRKDLVSGHCSNCLAESSSANATCRSMAHQAKSSNREMITADITSNTRI